MIITLSGQGAELAVQTKDWIQQEYEKGIRLFALEGLMGSGKTTTMRLIRKLMPMIVPIELDSFHDPRGAHLLRTWHQAFDQEDAIRHIRQMLRTHPVLIDGAICWPTARKCEAPTRYLYIKRMQFPGFWADQHELTETLDPDLVLRRSIRDYHATEMPWKKADVILERLIEDNGQ